MDYTFITDLWPSDCVRSVATYAPAGDANGSALAVAGASTDADTSVNTRAPTAGLTASTALAAATASVAVYPEAERFEKLTSAHDVIGRHDNKIEEN